MNKKQVTGKVLGDLESQIMEIIWISKDEVSVKDVAEVISKKRQIAYTTVMTIMTRLVNKGLLTRHLNRISYLYKPKLTKKRFVARAARNIFSSATSALGEEVFTYFIKEIKKIGPERRQQLLKLLGED